MSQKKIGFFTVIALVIGSQIGSGAFVAPAVMAPFGVLTFFGWILAGCGAISIALVFSKLCSLMPKTGGPHVYAGAAFGTTISFFVGWTYWVISWVSSIAVIQACVGYLLPVIGDHGSQVTLLIEVSLLLLISLLNLQGVQIAGAAEMLMTIMKMIPLVVVPLLSLHVFDIQNFIGTTEFVHNGSIVVNLGRVVMLAMWGFIGIELATTPAESVHNPQKTIPRAIVMGTTIVALVYLLNSIALFGGIPRNELANSSAPYADFVERNFGTAYGTFISIMTSIVCMGTLHAWILSAGQVGFGIARDRLFPKIFGIQNSAGAPIFSIIISAIFSIPLLYMTYKPSIASQVRLVMDFSVTAFLFVYVVCILALIKILIQRKSLKLVHTTYSSVALAFCGWMLCSTNWNVLLTALSFVVVGIPIYLWEVFADRDSALFFKRANIRDIQVQNKV